MWSLMGGRQIRELCGGELVWEGFLEEVAFKLSSDRRA